jgi:hypothetical protein
MIKPIIIWKLETGMQLLFSTIYEDVLALLKLKCNKCASYHNKELHNTRDDVMCSIGSPNQTIQVEPL